MRLKWIINEVEVSLCLIDIPAGSRDLALPLLLLADPCELVVRAYMDKGLLWILREESSGQMIAVALAIPCCDACNGKRWELKNLAVRSDWRGCGIGSYLTRFVADTCRQNGAESLIVGTSQQGRSFYRRLGFCLSYIIPNFFISTLSFLIRDPPEI